jgi:hypothetical protein
LRERLADQSGDDVRRPAGADEDDECHRARR